MMKLTIEHRYLLLLSLATILFGGCFAAPDNGFAPLHCNLETSIDSDDCLANAIGLSSLLSQQATTTTDTATLTIPCGMCVVVDITDGSTVTIPGGLNVVGRLHFPPEANGVLRTTAVFVQGLWSMEQPSDGNTVQVSLYGSGEKNLYPHDDTCCLNTNDFYSYDCSQCSNSEGIGRKPFVVAGGQLDIRVFDESCSSWSTLLEVDTDTMKSISVDSSFAKCLRPGDDLFVTSDSTNYESRELVTVDSVDTTTGKVILQETMPRVFPSVMGDNYPEHAVEVALLRRDVVFTAEDDEGEDWIGGHSIVYHTPTVVQTIVGVRFDNFGQEGILGRYPIHFHKSGDTSSLVSKNVIANSNQRCVFVHDTNGVTIDDNVAFETKGHCYATETGNEENNIFSYNLGASVKPLTKSNGQSDSVPGHGKGTSIFWIRNMKNTFIGNVAAGGDKTIGYWLEMKDKYSNQLHADAFRDNSAHSNFQGLITYQRGWLPSEKAYIKNFVTINNNEGCKHHITGNLVFQNAFFADNMIGVRYGAWNEGITFEDTRFVLTKAPWPGYIGISTSINSDPTRKEKTIALKNVAFQNYEGITAFEFYEDNRMDDNGMGDPLQAYNVTIETNGDEGAKPKLDDCSSKTRNWFLEDFDATLGPDSKGPGFLVRDHARTRAFLPPDGSCEALPYDDDEGCTAYCENVCLRLVRLAPAGRFVDTENYKDLKLTNVATGAYHSYPLQDDGFAAMVVLPPGQYDGEFLDEDGISLPVDEVEIQAFREPRCGDFVTESDFAFPHTVSPYISAGSNRKCPSKGRLFKYKDSDYSQNDGVEDCNRNCFNMPSCNYFSYSEDLAMCIACSLDDATDLSAHNGFEAYELALIKDDFGYELWRGDDGLNMKCPHKSNDRIVMETTETRKECYELCQDTAECGWFSWGEDQASSSDRGLCMLCRSDGNLEYHKHYNTYEMI